MSAPVIAVDGLRVAYGDIQALDGIDVEVARGSTLGVLGHNGAGKTTLIRVLTPLVRPDAGRVLVDGFDVVRQADQVRQRIGVTGQHAGLDDFLTGRVVLAGAMSALFGRIGNRLKRPDVAVRGNDGDDAADVRVQRVRAARHDPRIMRALAAFNPVSHATDALRGHVLGTATLGDTGAALAAAMVMWMVVVTIPDRSSH